MRRGEYGDSEDEDDYYNDVNDDFQQEDSFNYIAQMDEGDQQKGYEVINRVSESFYSRKSEPYEGFGGFA